MPSHYTFFEIAPSAVKYVLRASDLIKRRVLPIPTWQNEQKDTSE